MREIRKIKRENGFEKIQRDHDDLVTADLVIQFYLDLKKGDDNKSDSRRSYRL